MFLSIRRIALMAAVLLAFTGGLAVAQQDKPAKAPFPYVWATAYHVLEETTSEESGYFSLIEGQNGKVYVGTAAYGRNAYLVELDPKTGKQRIVIDTHKLNDIDASGIRAQAKIHTRNYVGKSGRIYVASKQGYPADGENPWDYPGGYVMHYDPKTDTAHSYGMIPFHAHGVCDIVADEDRGILYLATQSDADRQALWVRYDIDSDSYKMIYSNLSFYGQTLLDREGTAYNITEDNRIVSYNPDTGRVRVRPMMVDGERLTNDNETQRGVPTWIVTPNGAHAYLIYMSEPTLYRIDLRQDGGSFVVERLGGVLETDQRTDSRCVLSMGPDGRDYGVLHDPDKSGFGGHRLHHLTRYDPKTGAIDDLGVLAVKNPDFANFKENRGWHHGYHTLPDGTLTPLYNHMGLWMGSNGDAYVTIIYPYSVLHIKGVAKP